MNNIKFRYMTSDEAKQFGSADDEYVVVYLVAICGKKEIPVFFALLPFRDGFNRLNSYMKVFFKKGETNTWFTTRQEKIHKAANQYILDTTDTLLMEQA